MKNLFDKKTAKKPSKTKDKVIVDIPYEAEMKKMAKLDEKIASLTAQRQVLDSEVREACKVKMMATYDTKKSFPGTLTVQAGGMELTFITADRYKTIDEDRAQELTDKYGDHLVTETTKFSFNTKILMKNMDAINKMIVKSKDISDSDKEDLIEASTSWSVAKGTIKDLKNETYAKHDLTEIIDDIKPVFSVKALGEIEK